MRRRLSGLWMVINPKFRNLKSSSCSSARPRALGFRDRKESDVLQLICSVSLIAKRSGFSKARGRGPMRKRKLQLLPA